MPGLCITQELEFRLMLGPLACLSLRIKQDMWLLAVQMM